MGTTEKRELRIPYPLEQGRLFDSCIDFAFNCYKKHREGLSDMVAAQRYACGFPLPDFQRGHKWTEAQDVAFIESAYLGLPLGSYTLHSLDWDDSGKPLQFSGWLIDGQQRLTAIQRYFDDAFKVFGLYWSELTRAERLRFLRIKFTHYEIPLWDERQIRDLYNRLSFGGTVHLEEEKA